MNTPAPARQTFSELRLGTLCGHPRLISAWIILFKSSYRGGSPSTEKLAACPRSRACGEFGEGEAQMIGDLLSCS